MTPAQKVPLAAPHTGMRVNARGALTNIDRLVGRFLRQEMATHLEEMAQRYYSGEIEAVDEFCQLYCLGQAERKKLTEKESD